MKKFFMTCAIMLATLTASAQKGEMAVGGNLNIGLDGSYTNYGLGGKFRYGFLDKLRGEASFNYFFKKDYISEWDLSANLHYLVPLGDSGLTFYPLAGVTLFDITASAFGYSASDNRFGLNLGVGFEYPINDKWKVGAEGKIRIIDGSNEVISLGVAYTL